MNAGQRFARVVTGAVVARPQLWRLFRAPLRRQFDRLAPTWQQRVGPHHLDALAAALADVEPPARALDVGTGTGAAAFLVARRFPAAEVLGVDLAPEMVAEAETRTPAELAGRVAFLVADAAELPVPDSSCGLVTLVNAIPFFAELARVLAPGGTLLVSYSFGAQTPIYVPPERLRARLAAHGFAHFADFAAGPATCLRARRA